ncbi:MAG TPA: carbohydrate ABC transporter permease [Anaerolineae bacterium]|nr:carbohydrate ABC transporter permease [Anaerolineae bacterium]HOQ98604.1 carbohydrate ABC transporter permease [Anaerolineae bacterium]HPL28765.1 carbohydrate ABC transporter permease [Anaerolineae bacterium]
MTVTTSQLHARRIWKRRLNSSLFYLLVIVSMLPFVLPFVWMLMNSLKNALDITAIPPKLVFVPTLQNYRKIVSDPNLLLYFRNSAIIALGSTSLGLILGLPAAYSIARYRQSQLSLGVLLARIIPGMSLLVPWFIFFTFTRLRDTLVAMTATHLTITLPLAIWIMIGFFEDFPRELEDAAVVDGCSVTGALLRVAVPIVMPGIIVSFILGFTFSWNNFLYSMMIGGPATRTLPVVAYNQIDMYRTDWGAMAASAFVLTLPVLLITLFVQRYIVRGLTFGAVKG